MATSKSMFLTRVSDVVVKMALLQEEVSSLISVFISRGYSTSDPITDEDLANMGSHLTAEQFNTIVAPLLVDYDNFCNNKAVATKDRKTDIHKSRKDI